jgi:hypothetical protein
MLKRNLSDDNPEAFIEITGLQEEKETNNEQLVAIPILVLDKPIKAKNLFFIVYRLANDEIKPGKAE